MMKKLLPQGLGGLTALAFWWARRRHSTAHAAGCAGGGCAGGGCACE